MESNGNELLYKRAHTMEYFFYRQIWHMISLLVLVLVAWHYAAPVLGNGFWLGIRDVTWFWMAIGVPITHQVMVWIVFRLQLGWGTLSRTFGKYDLLVWAVIFLPLLIARIIVLVGLARANSNTLGLSHNIAYPIAIVLMIPAVYTLWSVFRYFGVIRAIGADHFRISYRNMSLVKEGIFKWNSNAMYAFAFFILWSIALFHGSQAALAGALFQHAYIWVHYFCTEKPDMRIIYDK